VDLEHPIITQINRKGYPTDIYIQDAAEDKETDEETEEE
jgi:hypothetical protein